MPGLAAHALIGPRQIDGNAQRVVQVGWGMDSHTGKETRVFPAFFDNRAGIDKTGGPIMSDTIRKGSITSPRVHLFPLSPETVRRLRQGSEIVKTSDPLDRRTYQTATHANDLQRRRIG